MSLNVQSPIAAKTQTPPSPPADHKHWNGSVSTARKQATTVGKRTTETSDITMDELREKYGIDSFGGNGLMGIKVNGKDTISDVATQKFVDELRKDLKEGKIDKDSDGGKLLDLIDAQGALQSGYDLYGYVEGIQTGAGTYRETSTDPTHLQGSDIEDMLDEKKISQKITDLMGKKSITDRYNTAVKEAIAEAPDAKVDAIKDQVMGALFKDDGKANLDFENFIITAKEKATREGDEGLADTLDAEVSNYFDALKYLAPDKSVSRQQEFNENMMTHQIDGYMLDPSSIDAKNKEAGLRSSLDMMLSGINSTLGTIDKTTKTYQNYVQMKQFITTLKSGIRSMSEDDINKLNSALNLIREKLPEAEKDPARWKQITNSLINDKLSGIAPGIKSDFRATLDNATGRGLFGSMMGIVNIVSASMQLSNGGWDKMTDDERIAAVRDLVGALSFGNDFATFGANIVKDLKGPDVDSPRASQLLGLLGKNFPDIWGKPSSHDAGLAKAVNAQIDEASKKLATSNIGLDDLEKLNEKGKPVVDKKALNESIKNLGNEITGGKVDPSISSKYGKTFLRFMGGAAFDITGGVMDLVTGVHALQNAHTQLQKAGAGVSIAGGTTSTAFGIINALKLFPSQIADVGVSIASEIAPRIVQAATLGLRVLGPALGVAAAVFGAIAIGISEAINHEKLQKLTDSQGAFFQRLADMGVAQDDWGDKLEYARYASYMYGGRDTPKDQSIFDYQSAEWDHFQNTPGEDGSSLSRLAPYLHIDGNFGEENLFEEYLNGETSHPTGLKDYDYHTDDWRPWVDTDLNAGTGGKENFDAENLYLRNSAIHAYDKSFYDDNKKYFDTIVSQWDNWNGDDSIVSIEDLQNIKNDDGRSADARDAAKWLLDNHDFWNALDGIRDEGNLDSKVSSGDLDTWLMGIGATTVKGYGLSVYDKSFFDNNKDRFDTALKHWDDWNGDDDIVSIEDLQNIRDDNDRTRAERDTAKWLLDQKGFWSLMDGIREDGDTDTKVSNADFDVWLDKIGAGVTVENYRTKTGIQDYDIAFYDDNNRYFDTIIRNWDNWNGGDDLVSIDDLHGIVSDPDRSQAQVDAAQWLLDHRDFWNLMDGIREDGRLDTKVSNDDFNVWLDKIGAGVTVENYRNKSGLEEYGEDFYNENKPPIDSMVNRWDTWNGSDDIVSVEDLQKLVAESDRTGPGIQAAKWLLDQDEFRHLLDGFRDGGNIDSKISNDDFNAWLRQVGIGKHT